MTDFGEFGRRGVQREVFRPSAPPEPDEDDALVSYLTMAFAVRASPVQKPVGEVCLPCEGSCFEVTVYSDGRQAPAARAPYELTMLDGSKREGTLDEQGRVRVEGEAVDPARLDVRARLEVDAEGAPARCRIALRASDPQRGRP